MNLINRFFRDEEGNDATEYALIITLVALAIVLAVTNLGTNIGAQFQAAADKL